MKEIVQHPDPVLRKQALPVSISDITSAKIQEVLSAMTASLESQDDGVAIAAPQIGVSLRIFIISHRAFKKPEGNVICINPEIIRKGRTKKEVSEGCLSVRWKYGTVKRSETATIRAYNEQGNEFTLSGKGLLAQIFQHEIDHLNGILFIDNAKHLEDVPPSPNTHE
jgi:peptide deformylase